MMNWAVDDAVDYDSLPADRSKTGGWIPATLILGIEMCERLSTMGIAVNLVTYLGGIMHISSSNSANIVTDFMGTSFLLCLFGGFLADSYLGRYKTIEIFAIIQTLGSALLAVTTKLPQLKPPPCRDHFNCKKASGFQMGFLYFALYFIALGNGGLKSSVSGFGADQFDPKDEKEKTQMTYFFNRLFFIISIGTFTAVTVLVYIQDNVSRSVAYGLCSVSMLISISIFFSGRKRYRYKRSLGNSPILHILQVFVAAIYKRNIDLPVDTTSLYENTPEIALRIHQTQQFRYLNKAAIITNEDIDENVHSSAPNPWKLCSVTEIEEVKMMARLMPIWATTIMFWTVYAQIITFSVEQATTMKRSIGSFQIPAGSLTVFFVAAVLFILAVYDRLIIPGFKRWKGKPGLTSLEKIATGLVFSILGMGAAGLVETKRLSVANSMEINDVTLPISVFLLIPQFVLVGSGEAMIYTGQLDFFITQSPKGMKALSTGLFMTTQSLGFFVSSLIVSIVKMVTRRSHGQQGWLADNINLGRLDCFYGLLTGLSFINFIVFLGSAVWYKRHKGVSITFM